MAGVRDLWDLRVYRRARGLQREVFRLSGGFPVEERYGLTSQARNSSRSVGANIAEAWRKRRYPAAFVAKLSDAAAEAEETRAHLWTAAECGYVDPLAAASLDDGYAHVLAEITRMQQQPHRWTPRRAQRAATRRQPRKWTPTREGRSGRSDDGSRRVSEPGSGENPRSGRSDEGSRRVSEGSGSDTPRSGRSDESGRQGSEGSPSDNPRSGQSDEGSRRVSESSPSHEPRSPGSQ